MKKLKYRLAKAGLYICSLLKEGSFKDKITNVCLINTDVLKEIYLESLKVNEEINEVCNLLKSKPGHLVDKIRKIQSNTKELELEIQELQK